MRTISGIDLSAGIKIIHSDGTTFDLTRAQFPAGATLAIREAAVQSLLDQSVNPLLIGEYVAIHIYSLGPPINFVLGRWTNRASAPPGQWWP